MSAHLLKFFNPKSIAVIGASRSKRKVGGVILRNLLSSHFPARVYVVNPNSVQVQKQKSYDTIMEVPEIVDTAIITIPSQFVEDVVEECGQKGVKNVIVISSGYSESGKDGLGRELRLKDLAHKYQINLLGPNCLGIIDARNNLNLSFASNPKRYSNGKVSMISQSGAIGTAFLDWANTNNLEVSKFISLGNKAGLNELDFLKYLEQDKDSEIILMYLENFSDGRQFFELAKKITRKKPIIVLKPGKTEASEVAMTAHTGSLASSDKIVDQALKDSGCIRVDSIEELFNITKILTWQPVLRGNQVVVLTNAGGVAIDAIDQLSQNGLEITNLPESLQTSLSKAMKSGSSTKNPIDLLGDALASDYKEALEKVVKSRTVNCVLVLLTPQFMTESLQTARYINDIADKHNKVVVASFLGGEKVKVAQAFLTKEKIPHFQFANDASVLLGKIWGWRKFLKKTISSRLNYPTIINPTLKVKKGEILDEKTTKKLLDKFDINYLKSSVFENFRAITLSEKNIKFPLVLKLVSPKLIHKTELKAVRLPIYKKSELFQNARELDAIAKKENLDDYKFEIQPFVFQKLEMILGINRDKDTIQKVGDREILKSKGFGHVLLLGAGGIYTEILEDSSLKFLPINRIEAMEMLESLKISKALFGARGRKYDTKGLLKMIANLSRLVEHNSNIKAIDMNPVFVTEDDVYAVDVKIFVE